MGSEWPTVPLGELVEMSADKIETKSIPEKCYVSTDSMLPDFGGVSFNRATPSVAKTSSFSKEDILFSNIRTYFRKLWIADRNGGCSNDVIVFRSKENVHPEFMFYSMMDERFIQHTVQTSKGTKMPRGDKSAIIQYRTILPPLPEQKAIAHILGTLDDKIELNRRMNATLEGMAQALFKSWFVDFDPVIDNALAAGNPIPDELAPRAEVRRQALANDTANREAAKPFPAAFQETESMGWIPEGWEVESIYKLISVIYGAPFKSSMFIPAGEGMPVIRIRDLKTGTTQNWTTEDHPKKKLIKTGDVVVGMDAEFRATIWPGENGYLNQRLFLARPKEGSVNNFFVQHSLAPQLEFEENTQVGTTVSHLGKKELDKFTALNPGKELLFEYSKATTPLLERLVSNHVALKTLTRLRDTLLPKLISGELRVSEAEQLTEEALT